MKELTLTICHKNVDNKDLSYCLKHIELNKLKELQSFECICHRLQLFLNENGFIQTVIKNVIDFLQFIKEKQLNETKLKHIQLLHMKYRNDNYRNRNVFKKLKLSAMESQKICTTLIEINAIYPKIEYIELQPVAICQQELAYLYFWFMEKMSVYQLHKVRTTYFMDLILCNRFEQNSLSF